MPCSDPYVKVTFAPASGVESLRGEKTTTIKKVCYTAEQDLQLDMFACSLTQSGSCLDADVSHVLAEVFPRAPPSFPSPAVLYCMQVTERWAEAWE